MGDWLFIMKKIIQAVAYQIEPGLREKGEAERTAALWLTAGSLWLLPFAAGGLIWLVAATDTAVIRESWAALLLLAGVHFLFGRLNFFFQREAQGGGYIMVSGSFVALVTWSAALIFGPSALWIALVLSLVNVGLALSRLNAARLRANNLFDLSVTIIAETFAPLLALALYAYLGGRHPLPGLGWAEIWPAASATLLYIAVPFLLFLPAYYPQLKSKEGVIWGDFFRMLLFANGFGMATLPFAILGAGLYGTLGLGVYLALLGGGLLVNLLAYRFSQILNSLEERALELRVLEALGRELIAAPPELAALPDLLGSYAPRLNKGRTMAIWLLEGGELYRRDRQGVVDRERLTAVLREQAADPSFSHLLENGFLLLPIWSEKGHLLGGLYAAAAREQLPALQSLAAQIASAIHRVETYQQRIASEKMTRELEIAGEIQATFLPRDRPRLPGWEIAATLIPARQTSGDFYDFVELDNGRTGFVVADVADKGTGAALYMALSRTLLRTYAMQFPAEPARALQAVNERILADTHSDQFVTVFYGVLEVETGLLTYANAGHNPALVVGTQAAQLGITGIPLGMFPDQSWRQRQFQLEPGDVLVMYTDGVTEAMNGRQEEFGDQRLQQLTTERAAQPVGQIQAAIQQAVQTFAGEAPQADDITLLLVQRSLG
jgi:serine phosphatase RsbU (regulator of sigma subunit)